MRAHILFPKYLECLHRKMCKKKYNKKSGQKQFVQSFGIRRKYFVQTFWSISKTLAQTCWIRSQAFLHSFWVQSNTLYQIQHLDFKQCFCSSILFQKQVFNVQTFWIRSQTLSKHFGFEARHFLRQLKRKLLEDMISCICADILFSYQHW